MKVQEIIDILRDCHPDEELLVSMPTRANMLRLVNIVDIEMCQADDGQKYLIAFPFVETLGGNLN